MEPLLVITNSGAGPDEEQSLETALAMLRAHASVEVAATANPGELDSVLHRAGSRRIVVAGGDGSLHAVISVLHKRNELDGRVLGLLPLGTGNDFARANDIPLDCDAATELILTGEARPVDLIVDDRGAVVVNNVHVGAGAQAARRGARWKERLKAVGVGGLNLGKLGYPLGVLQAAFLPPQLRLHVEVDGQLVNGLDEPVLMVAIGNGTSVGGGAELTPDADTEDRLLDVMVSRSTGPLAKIGYAVGVARGTHPERDDVRYLRGRAVSISGEAFWCSADGEIDGPVRSRSWRLVPAAYSMILP